MSDLLDIVDWPDRVNALVQQIGAPLIEGHVIAVCDSTQESAQAMGPGGLVVAGRQVAGRGQRGNQWIDTGSEGLAFSLALSATDQPERSQALAEAIVAGLDPMGPGRFTVKPPNDVLLDGRKVAGVLVEQSDGLAVIGIGINVKQLSWPPALDGQAISLLEAGIELKRIDVLERILPGVISAWST
ncbi:MAG: biotin--[acetyl-CoA-carboxylase] ligase [Planctomycetota bacterium]|nr:biotin--[acetyl-CoA-carboxylase] ligase [Planctomycetota bacterium]